MAKSSLRWIFLIVLVAIARPVFALETIKIGVEYSPEEPTPHIKWSSLATALGKAIPGYVFIIENYSGSELQSAVASRQIGFVITNPASYLLIDHFAGLSAPFASLRTIVRGQSVATFGGVIFTRANRQDIRTLADLKGKLVATESMSSFSDYQVEAYELFLAGVRFPVDFRTNFSGSSRQRVIDEVLTGKADAGFIRSGFLEGIAEQGKLDFASIKIVNKQDLPGYPVVVSTRLYPEWVVGSLPHTDKDLTRKVASFLLSIGENIELSKTIGIHGFDVPSDYSSVEQVMRDLRVPPFEIGPDFTYGDVFSRYRNEIVTGLIGLITLLILSARLVLVNRRLDEERTRAIKGERYLDVTMRSIGDAVLATNHDGRVTMMNPVAEALTGWSEVEALNRPVTEVFHIVNQETRARVVSPIELVLESGLIVGLANHTVLISRDGTERPIADSGAPIRSGNNGEISGVVLVFRDQTEEYRIQQALRDSERLYSTLVTNVPVGIYFYDIDNGLRYANQCFLEILGLDADHFSADACFAAIHPDDRERMIAVWQNAVDRIERVDFEPYRYPHADGSVVWVNGMFTPVFDERGKHTGFTGLVQDITAEREKLHRIEQLSSMYASLSQVNSAVIHCKNEEELFGRICSILVDNGNFTSARISIADWVRRQEIRVAMAGASIKEMGGNFAEKSLDDPEFRSLTIITLLSGENMVSSDYLNDERIALSYREMSRNIWEVKSASTVALKRFGETVAVLALTSAEKNFFNEELLALVDEVGRDVSFSLEIFAQNRQREQAEEEQRRAQKRFEKLFRSSPNALLITNMQGKILECNELFERMAGLKRAEMIGRTTNELGFWRNPDDRQRALNEIQHKGQLDSFQMEGVNAIGEPRTVLIFGNPIELNDDQCFLYHVIDITSRKIAEARIEQLAYRDALTNLPNRLLLRDRVEQSIAAAHRDGGTIALLFLDLDHFKNVNDSFGHSVGDSLLKEVAQTLTVSVREADTVGRLGGDEFLLVLPGADAAAAAQVADKHLREGLQYIKLELRSLRVTASIGIALYPEDGTTFDDLLKAADTAMYRAKAEGRNAFRFYTKEMNQAVFQHMVLESNLHKAIENNELLLHYQPKFDLKDRTLVGAEALVRWQHPEMGMISPGQFIPVAESSDLILDVGQWVLDDACRQIRAWADQGLPPVRVAVNFSSRQFAARNLVQTVTGSLLKYGLDGEVLEIEITESLLTQDMDYTLSALLELKKLGIHIAVDDFGTGYSSLSYLKRFPIDRLKIDQSFVRDLATDPNDRAIATAVVTLGHSLGMKVIAEGIETAEQMDILDVMGCDEMQGYYLGRPAPANALAVLLAKT